ncbi:MAG: hypothetical protein PUE66_03560 [Erysipelotrichaceae bacterium]|nr:hypothetical protein [Erysipelotrichaceae bacterium]
MNGRSRLDRYQNLRSGLSNDSMQNKDMDKTLDSNYSNQANNDYLRFNGGRTTTDYRNTKNDYDAILKEHEDFLKSLDMDFANNSFSNDNYQNNNSRYNPNGYSQTNPQYPNNNGSFDGYNYQNNGYNPNPYYTNPYQQPNNQMNNGPYVNNNQFGYNPNGYQMQNNGYNMNYGPNNQTPYQNGFNQPYNNYNNLYNNQPNPNVQFNQSSIVAPLDNNKQFDNSSFKQDNSTETEKQHEEVKQEIVEEKQPIENVVETQAEQIVETEAKSQAQDIDKQDNSTETEKQHEEVKQEIVEEKQPVENVVETQVAQTVETEAKSQSQDIDNQEKSTETERQYEEVKQEITFDKQPVENVVETQVEQIVETETKLQSQDVDNQEKSKVEEVVNKPVFQMPKMKTRPVESSIVTEKPILPSLKPNSTKSTEIPSISIVYGPSYGENFNPYKATTLVKMEETKPDLNQQDNVVVIAEPKTNIETTDIVENVDDLPTEDLNVLQPVKEETDVLTESNNTLEVLDMPVENLDSYNDISTETIEDNSLETSVNDEVIDVIDEPIDSNVIDLDQLSMQDNSFMLPPEEQNFEETFIEQPIISQEKVVSDLSDNCELKDDVDQQEEAIGIKNSDNQIELKQEFQIVEEPSFELVEDETFDTVTENEITDVDDDIDETSNEAIDDTVTEKELTDVGDDIDETFIEEIDDTAVENKITDVGNDIDETSIEVIDDTVTENELTDVGNDIDETFIEEIDDSVTSDDQLIVEQQTESDKIDDKQSNDEIVSEPLSVNEDVNHNKEDDDIQSQISEIEKLVGEDTASIDYDNIFAYIDNALDAVKADYDKKIEKIEAVQDEKLNADQISDILSSWNLDNYQEEIRSQIEKTVESVEENYRPKNSVDSALYYANPADVEELNQKLEKEKLLRQQVLEQTKQINLQVKEYENELDSVNDNMSRTNKILNFVLTLLIMTLFVILFVIGFWFAQERGLL